MANSVESMTTVNLSKLKIDLSALDDDSKRAEGWNWYKTLYLTEPNKNNIGIISLHDDDKAIFHGTTFDHAFFKSSNYQLHPRRKDVIDESRLERVRWIGPLIAGLVPHSSCWEVVALNGRPGIPNRVYVAHSQSYLVWLEPRANQQTVQWKFMSAFPTFPKYINDKVTNVGTKIWTSRTPKNSP